MSADRLPPHQGLGAFQANIEAIYGAKDAARGVPETYMWFVEEVGELGRALRRGEPENLREEVGDVLAWLTTLASLTGIDLEDAAARYTPGCPRCGACPCDCRRGKGRE
ncbi:MAG: nucleotide pyrophosphohydrolase [Planctomycetota bacterium]|nr:nucleotide pyrophosphohydrolase [Planctomycetota bacterium]